MPAQPGVIALIGSGETAANGGRAFESVARRYPPPLRVAILETPAGFELNSERVAGRIAGFIETRLQNHAPQIAVIPARRRGDACGPDNPEILAPLATADIIFMGPGSPTYAIRQLRGTLAWQAVLARHGEGASLVLASAAAIAASLAALPVYEIYKAGEDLGWRDGLDLLGRYGLRLAIVPHWDNAEGGSELDTSRCFMGQARFSTLAAMLPQETGILGIDEHTTLLIDPQQKNCSVIGRGEVTILSGGVERSYAAGSAFRAMALGSWREAELPEMPEALRAPSANNAAVQTEPPQEVLRLAERREDARQRKDWSRADALRAAIEALGWQVRDTPSGPEIVAR
jgi:cyanophycinase-like exopeptidase